MGNVLQKDLLSTGFIAFLFFVEKEYVIFLQSLQKNQIQWYKPTIYENSLKRWNLNAFRNGAISEVISL